MECAMLLYIKLLYRKKKVFIEKVLDYCVIGTVYKNKAIKIWIYKYKSMKL